MQDGDTIEWVLADNRTIMATKAALAEALYLAGQEQSRLWVKKDETTEETTNA